MTDYQLFKRIGGGFVAVIVGLTVLWCPVALFLL